MDELFTCFLVLMALLLVPLAILTVWFVALLVGLLHIVAWVCAKLPLRGDVTQAVNGSGL